MWRGQAQFKGSAKTAGKDAAKKKNVAGEKLKVTLTHAALNDAVLGIAAFNWCATSASLENPWFHSDKCVVQVGPPARQGPDPPPFERLPLRLVRPYSHVPFTSAPRLLTPESSRSALPLFVYSAYLGGSLVYEYGVGIMRQGEGAEIKEKQEKEQ